MPETPLETIERLETLAAWYRISAEPAGADWVWEARLRTAEDLERQAAEMRHNCPIQRQRRRNLKPMIYPCSCEKERSVKSSLAASWRK